MLISIILLCNTPFKYFNCISKKNYKHLMEIEQVNFFYPVFRDKLLITKRFEPHRDKTNKMACAPSEDSDQPGHPPSLIRVFAVRLMGS